MKPVFGFKVVRRKVWYWWALGFVLPRNIWVNLYVRGGRVEAQKVRIGVWYQVKASVRDVTMQPKMGAIGCLMYRARGRE